ALSDQIGAGSGNGRVLGEQVLRGTGVAVIPADDEFRGRVAGAAEFPFDMSVIGIVFRGRWGFAVRNDAVYRAGLYRAEDRVEDMAGHIAEGACPERLPLAPVAGMV